MSSLVVFILIWGVWLITPIMVDGIDSLVRIITVWAKKGDALADPLDDEFLPTMAIIVPAHNEAAVIDRCLNSIKAQDYPSDKLEIIVVDDGSTDGTGDRVEEHVNGTHEPAGDLRLRGEPIRVGPFNGKLTLVRRDKGGKASALNAGIALTGAEIVVNIDSDVVLAPHTMRAIASKFAADPAIGALTGNIEIDWDILEARDHDGNIVVDEDGCIVPRRLSFGERYLATSQFLEYLASFDLGRRAQSITSTMYTLAGACSAFRREVLTPTVRYSSDTVSEDTCLTFQLHRSDVKIGFAEEAKVYLEPVTTWDELYAQRARWTRGQLEVCGQNNDIVGRRGSRFGRVSVPKMLLFDHTMAFPRLIWAPLLLMFPMLGYSYSIIAAALVAMYVFYVLIEILGTLSVFSIADAQTRSRIERSGWTLLLLPVYRFIVFHFRFSGFLVTLMEEQQWTIPGPLDGTRRDLRTIGLRSIEFATGLMGGFLAASERAGRFALSVIAPLLITLLLVVTWVNNLFKRSA